MGFKEGLAWIKPSKKDMAVPTPTRSGKLLLTQVIIRGTSKRCLVQGHAIDPNIV